MQNNIHVLHIVEAFAAGTLTAVSQICHALNNGYVHSILHSVRSETPSNFKDLFPANCSFYYMQMEREILPIRDLKTFLTLISKIKTINPDIVHCHSSKAGALGRAAAWFCGLPSVYTPHSYSFLQTNYSPFKRKIFRAGEWLGTRFGTAIAACGEHEFRLARELGGKGYIIFSIPNSINLKMMDSVTPEYIDSDLPAIGISGRYSPQRQPMLFCSIAENVKHLCTSIWIGADPESRIFMQQAGWTGIEHKVCWPGWIFMCRLLRGKGFHTV